MPTYDYECDACGHEFELFQSISEPVKRKCPECGKSQLRRLVSAPQFRLKGSGWYETDFKSDKEQKRNLLDKGDAEPPKSEDRTAAPKPSTTAKPEAAAKPAAAPKRASGARPARAARPAAKAKRTSAAKRRR